MAKGRGKKPQRSNVKRTTPKKAPARSYRGGFQF